MLQSSYYIWQKYVNIKRKAILLDAIRKCQQAEDETLMDEFLSEYMKLFPSDIPSDIPPASFPAETACAILELSEDKDK